MIFSLCVCVRMNRFNHELVFGISVKNLSKAERLIYGDSLMTHDMILTAVTDKVCLHKCTAQVCFCSVNPCKHTVRMQADQRKHQGFLLCVYIDLIGCSLYIVMSISPLISYPSCSLLQSLLVTLIFFSLSLSQDEKGGYEKWRVENSWGDDRGNKGNKHIITLFLLSVLSVRV